MAAQRLPRERCAGHAQSRSGLGDHPPADAADLGISAGDAVRLRNPAGNIILLATIAEAAPRGVLISYKGRWPKLEEQGRNINVLHEAKSSDIDGCTAIHGTEVTIERVG